MSDIWQCHRCGQKNYGTYYRCMQCETKKYICPECGKVEYEKVDGGQMTVIQRLKFVLGL